MLSIIQAAEIKNAVVEYLKATYNFNDRQVEQAFEDFLYSKRNGMFKGPYVQIRLPFEKVEKGTNLNEVLAIHPNFDPYLHQYESFKRLSTQNNQPQPVILTTGTGSGKTESFLYPLLDYCFKNVGRPGIKAIILYPMNALATDQARRLADTIYNHQNDDGEYLLRDKIRAGLFIGEGKQKGKDRPARMEKDRIIEDRETIVNAPPDILLTNFKMLDFALMLSQYNNLWKYNLSDTSLLKLIVLDELHTYDGAKGSDVANLIRRLKLKLHVDNEQLIPVGTSATMAGGETGKEDLVKFFSLIFGIAVTKEAVIEEQRIHPEMFFDGSPEIPVFNFDRINECEFYETDEYESYIKRQLELWNYTEDLPILYSQLRKNRWLMELVEVCGQGVVELEEATNLWWKRCFPNEAISYDHSVKLIRSLTGILSFAKEQSGSKSFPFLYFQTSYWIRSLHRVLKKVQPYPLFAWQSDLNPNETTESLPPYYCRECGGSGWVGLKKDADDFLSKDLKAIRSQFIADRNNKNLYFISSIEDRDITEVIAEDYTPTDRFEAFIDPETLDLLDRKYHEGCFKVLGVKRQVDTKVELVCPHCNERNTLALIGTGLPTLESIVTAQLMSTATDPASDHDRKLLAFTNGVQDAAHQAGFIENRNYRFGMRHAIQLALKHTSERISLTDFYRLFEETWQAAFRNEEYPEEAYVYKYLPPDCDARLDISKYKTGDHLFTREFRKEYSCRISWEIWSEFSFSAGIGRTLEKAGASAVEFDVEKFSDVFKQMRYWLQKETLGDRITEKAFFKFLLGFLHRIRMKGGVDHTYLTKYRSEKTNYYLITQNTNKRHFLIKNFGKHSRLPKFVTLTTNNNTAAFEIIQTHGGKQNWYSAWFLKCFDLVGKEEKELINDFYQQLIDYLVANKLLDTKVAAGVQNAGVNPDEIFLNTKVSTYECNKCGNVLNIGEGNSKLVEGMKCMQYRCSSEYKAIPTGYDYYRMVYNRGRALRIFAKDHTGLIDRTKREVLERDFKLRPTYQSTNVLVATSTLEMGIDIGDLNIAFNASIPPETSNYLQRVGRAGRSSGTSLIVNLAGRDEHDQYYFDDTMAMMQGDIRTPACYLGATDILRRHFMAFCFDEWSSEDPGSHYIPPIVRLLRLKSTRVGDPAFIFNRVAQFIDTNKSVLIAAFKQKYQHEDAIAALNQIEADLHAGRPVQALRSVQEKLLAEFHYYDQKRDVINRQLATLPATGPETEALVAQKRAISGAINNINARNTIEYLTNTGILPNYAFPETGVHINAQIVSKIEGQGGMRYKVEDFGEIVRPASSAITELAPSNTFYSQGHKLESQGIEIFSTDDYETWRFCSNCDAIELDVKVPKDEVLCPKCNHMSWGSIANKKTIVKLEGVLSINNREESKINDSSDDRERKFYTKSIHFRTIRESSRGAKVLKRVPFGIEFFTHAEYIEINTGIREEGFFGARQISINEKDHPEVGFVVCKKCGKATERPLTQREIDSRHRSYHFNYCANRNVLYNNQEDDYFSEVYLYRRFNTEALQILLPVQSFRSNESVAIFKAGLMLGLKEYYKGHPDHINIRPYEEFNRETGRKENYLVMYETIPGGTGYLSKLFNTDEFNQLLNVAYNYIKHCSCKDEGKDGCYKCIYTYANQFDREILSREEAEQLFKEIIEQSNEWNEIDTLRNLGTLNNREESELEDRFVELLKNEFKSKADSDFVEVIENNCRQYRLTLGVNGHSVCYEINPQNLGNYLAGVKYSTRPDFLFKCVSLTRDNAPGSFADVQSVKNIVVYLDGYQYHATQENFRVLSDLKIRDAIVKSNRYYQWSFTWNDIQDKQSNLEDHLYKLIQFDHIDRVSKIKTFSGFDFAITRRKNNFERFVSLLKQPLYQVDLSLWSSFQFFGCQNSLLGKCIEESCIENIFATGAVDESSMQEVKPDWFAYSDKLVFKDELKIIGFVQPKIFKLKAAVVHHYPTEHYDQENWELFWQVYNLIQFSEFNGVEHNYTSAETAAFDSMLLNFRKELHTIVGLLVTNHISINTDLDFDLMNDEEIIAQAELGSHEKCFFMLPYNEASRRVFLDKGYQEFTIENFDINKIR